MPRDLKPFDGVSPYGASYGGGGGAPVQTIDLRRVMVALRRQRLTILLPAVLLGGLGLAYAMAKPETYSAYSSLLLDSNVNRSVQQAGGIDSAGLPSERIENARVVLESDKLTYDVLDRTGLQDNASFMDPPRSGFTSAIGQGISTVLRPVAWLRDKITLLVTPAEVGAPAGPVADSARMDPSIAPIDPRLRLAAMRLRGGVEVFRVGQSSAVAVSFTSHDPVIAAEVANAYADAYVQDILVTNADSVGQTNAWMRTRLGELQAQAQAAADAAERFATENGLVAFGVGCPEPQLTGETATSVKEGLDELLPTLVDQDGLERARIVRDIRHAYPRRPALRAAIDLALHDLLGKIARQPTWRLLGGYRREIATASRGQPPASPRVMRDSSLPRWVVVDVESRLRTSSSLRPAARASSRASSRRSSWVRVSSTAPSMRPAS